jgi:hypothetical protein
MLSINALVYVVLLLLVVAAVFGILLWVVNYLNPPEPFNKGIRVVLVVGGALVVIGILLSLIGGQPIFRP